jgi:hypothetical protein
MDPERRLHEPILSLPLTLVFETVEAGWTQVQIAEIPGVITCAPTHDEARELVADALREYLLSFDEDPPSTGQRCRTESLVLTLSR